MRSCSVFIDTDFTRKIRLPMTFKTTVTVSDEDPSVMAHHHLAMSLADVADEKRTAGDEKKAKDLFAKALSSERKAAMHFLRFPLEPTRSILFRSAAELALEAGEWREAEKLACLGLAGEPPAEIQAELRMVIMKKLANEMSAELRVSKCSLSRHKGKALAAGKGGEQ